MPAQYFSSGPNHIGISNQSWNSCFSCNNSSCVEVDNGSGNDQFSSFRGDTLALLFSENLQTCKFMVGDDFSHASQGGILKNQQTLACTSPFLTLMLNLNLSAELFDIVPVAPQAVGVFSALSVVLDEKAHMGLISGNVTNVGDVDGSFQLVSLQCCSSTTGIIDCCGTSATNSILVNISPGSVAHVNSTISFGALNIIFGGCEFELLENNANVQQYVYASFYSMATTPPPPPQTSQQQSVVVPSLSLDLIPKLSFLATFAALTTEELEMTPFNNTFFLR